MKDYDRLSNGVSIITKPYSLGYNFLIIFSFSAGYIYIYIVSTSREDFYYKRMSVVSGGHEIKL